MQAIKALVFFMGFLLIAGLGLLGYGMYTKAGRSVKSSTPVVTTEAPPVGTSAATAPTAFGTIVLDQPVGTRIVESRLEGGLLMVRLAEGGQADRVGIVDLAAGRLLGMVTLEAGAPTAEVAPEAPVGD